MKMLTIACCLIGLVLFCLWGDDVLGKSQPDPLLAKLQKTATPPSDPYEFTKTTEAWKKLLTASQFHILRERGTEPPFANQYHNFKGKGLYHCAACQNALFSSETKYDSHTGWPSFWQPLTPNQSVRYVRDSSHGSERVEVVCNRCGSHLGHVFSDGPKPTGLRYCMNSASLKFK